MNLIRYYLITKVNVIQKGEQMNIAKLRSGSGFTQESLAELLNVDRSTVAKWETGVSLPRAKVLVRLAEILGCKVDDLLRKEESSGES